jgi:hypothetical protein
MLAHAGSADVASLRPNAFVVTALRAAWSAIEATKHRSGPAHLEAGLRAAVAIGHDTDTVAAIAGALLGARYGAAAVPFAWRRGLRGWPADLTGSDLVGLAVLGVQRGESDPNGWPRVDDLMHHYREGWNLPGRVYSLGPDDGVLWGDVGALASVKADGFISLCRIGTEQRRGSDHYEIWIVDSAAEGSNADVGFVLRDTVDAITTLRAEGRRVFVHCVMSESRTPAVAVAWLILAHGYSLESAHSVVLTNVPQAHIRSSFRDALATLEARA